MRAETAPASVEEYLATLPADRREALQAVRKVILKNLDREFEEGMQYGMIGYYVPHRVYPAGYHCDPKQPLPFAALASQKNHMAVYLMCQYGSPEEEQWFRQAWSKTGRKLDMGKSCVRFRKLEDVALEVIGEAIRRVPARAFVAQYEALRAQMGGKSKAAKPAGNGRKKAAGKTAGKSAEKTVKKASKKTAKKASTRK